MEKLAAQNLAIELTKIILQTQPELIANKHNRLGDSDSVKRAENLSEFVTTLSKSFNLNLD